MRYKTTLLFLLFTTIGCFTNGFAQSNNEQTKRELQQIIASLKSERINIERKYQNITRKLKETQRQADFKNAISQTKIKVGESKYSETTLTSNEQQILTKVLNEANNYVKKSYDKLIEILEKIKQNQLEDNSKLSTQLENISRNII